MLTLGKKPGVKTRQKIKYILIPVALLIVFATWIHEKRLDEVHAVNIQPSTSGIPEIKTTPDFKPAAAITLKPDANRSIHTIAKGESLYTILSTQGISPKEISFVSKSLKGIFKLNALRPGKAIVIKTSGASGKKLDAFFYEISPGKYLIVEKVSDGFKANISASSNISETLAQMNPLSASADDFYEDISQSIPASFEFVSTNSPEDMFENYYERHYSKYKVKPSYKRLNLVKKSIKKPGITKPTYLKAPLRYAKISSGFTFARVHPVYNEVKPHLGIDYAAPHGTPVKAIAAGKIIYVGWEGGYGKTVRIKHPNGKVSHYGHLARYAKNLNTGKQVKMGQIIGNVGSTGIATGSHLDFRISYKGKFINPLSLDSTGAVSKHKKSLAKKRDKRTYSKIASLKKKSSVKTARSGRSTKKTRG